MDNNQTQFLENYVLQQEFIKTINSINNEITKLQNEVDLLRDKKANLSDLQQIKQDIALLNAKISEISNDRKDDREIIKTLTQKIENLTNMLNNANLTNVEVKTNQKNTFEKIDELKKDIAETRKDISEIKEGLHNSLGSTLTRLFNTSKVFKCISIVVLVILGMTIFTSFLFYTTHGIPWSEITKLFNAIHN